MATKRPEITLKLNSWTFAEARKKLLIQCVAKHPDMHPRDIGKLMGVSERTIYRLMKELDERNTKGLTVHRAIMVINRAGYDVVAKRADAEVLKKSEKIYSVADVNTGDAPCYNYAQMLELYPKATHEEVFAWIEQAARGDEMTHFDKTIKRIK